MARVEHNKLVRDFIPDTIRANGDACETTTLDDEGYIREIRRKLTEEADELSVAETREQILKEYADLMVALDAFTAHFEFSEADIKSALAENIERKGLFQQRVFLVSTTTDDA